MDAIAYVRREFALMRRHVGAITQDLTREALLWEPPGEANAIAATLVHVMTGEDRLIQAILQGRPTLWDAGNWGERVGLGVLPIRRHDWGGVDLTTLRDAALFAYGGVVQEATASYLASLTDADLDEDVEVYGERQPRSQALLSIVIHNVSHAGEIAALKGVRGGKGRPT